MGTARPICLLRGPGIRQDASPVQTGLAPTPPAPPAAAAWPSTAHAARCSRGGPWPRASRCCQVMVFPGRHPRRGQARVPAPRWEGTGAPQVPAPAAGCSVAAPRPQHPGDGTRQNRMGRDGAVGAVQASPVRWQHGPGLCGGSAAGGTPGTGSFPSPPGAPQPRLRTCPDSVSDRRGAPSPGAGSPSAQNRSPRWARTPARPLFSSSTGRAEPSSWALHGGARPAPPQGRPPPAPVWRRSGWGLALPRLQEPS